MVETSTLITIIYFSLNAVMLFSLGLHVHKTGFHKSITSKSYIKDVWNQRKIYAPLLVHFYDTATDIGVVYFWYTLHKNEQKYGDDFYQSVDMTVFFYCGITFLLLYRILTLCYVLLNGFDIWRIPNSNEAFSWCDPILVLLDLYIFKAIYASFLDAKKVIEKGRNKRKNKNKSIEMENPTKLERVELGNGVVIPSMRKLDQIAVDDDIEPSPHQQFLQLGESITESMPQIMLQSVFIIRSANDPSLVKGTNILLIMLSIVASLCSISNKFITFDRQEFLGVGESLSPSKRFPTCIDFGYIVRVIWRICHIANTFSVYVLLWVVLGGAYLPIFCAIKYLIWTIIFRYVIHEPKVNAVGLALIYMVAVLLYENTHYRQIIGWIFNGIGYATIFYFATKEFNCWNCADEADRQFVNHQGNGRIVMFFTFGCGSFLIEVVLYCAVAWMINK
eukprot:516548_1